MAFKYYQKIGLILITQSMHKYFQILLYQLLNHTFQVQFPQAFSIPLNFRQACTQLNNITMSQQKSQKKHPVCRYGGACKIQETCWFSHSITNSISTNFQSVISGQGQAKNNSKISKSGNSGSSQIHTSKNSHISQGSSVSKQKSDIRSNRKCRYGQDCRSKATCKFRHPGDSKIQIEKTEHKQKNKYENSDQFYLQDIQRVSQQRSSKNLGIFKSNVDGFFFEQFPNQLQQKNSCQKNYGLNLNSNSEYPNFGQITQQNYFQLYKNQHYQQMVNQYPNIQQGGYYLQKAPYYQQLSYGCQPTQNMNNWQSNPQRSSQQKEECIAQNQNHRKNLLRSRNRKLQGQKSKKAQESESDSSLSGQSQNQQQLIFNKKIQTKKKQIEVSQRPLFGLVNNFFEKFTLHQKPQDIAHKNLTSFFNRYKISENYKVRIIEFIEQKKLVPQQICDLVAILQQLLDQGFKQYFGYISMAKIAIKKKFNLDIIQKKLNQAKNPIIKKRNKEAELYKRFPNPRPIKFLELPELQQLDLNKTIFLIDGNNVLVTNGKFRKYFQSKDDLHKVEAQIRLHWIVGQTLNGCLFFDDEYDQQIKKYVQNSFMSSEQQQFLDQDKTKIRLFYARKKEDKNATADQILLEKLKQLHKKIINIPMENTPEIVLVSADRILTQQCLEVRQIKKTSGKQFIKYCKKVLKNKYYSDPSKKGIIKKIFTYRF